MRSAIIYGTRPEIIKLRSIIRLMPEAVTIFTGQQNAREMTDSFLDELGVRRPDISLATNCLYNIGSLKSSISEVFLKDGDIQDVIVQGDTNTALAGALAGNETGVPVVHVEAGLRCGTRMVEEINRIVIDSLSWVLFPPTWMAMKNLVNETTEDFVSGAVVGNTGVDCFKDFWPGRGEPKHHLLTLHRPENVDCPYCLDKLLSEMSTVAEKSGVEVVFPVHPRTRPVRAYKGVRTTIPVGYVDMLNLLSESAIVWTDSGGVQEEACVGGVPCITIRPSTERQETVTAGANRLATENLAGQLDKPFGEWDKGLYGDGRAGERIVDILKMV